MEFNSGFKGLKISAVRGSGRTANTFYFVGIVAVFSAAPKGYGLRLFDEQNR